MGSFQSRYFVAPLLCRINLTLVKPQLVVENCIEANDVQAKIDYLGSCQPQAETSRLLQIISLTVEKISQLDSKFTLQRFLTRATAAACSDRPQHCYLAGQRSPYNGFAFRFVRPDFFDWSNNLLNLGFIADFSLSNEGVQRSQAVCDLLNGLNNELSR